MKILETPLVESWEQNFYSNVNTIPNTSVAILITLDTLFQVFLELAMLKRILP